MAFFKCHGRVPWIVTLVATIATLIWAGALQPNAIAHDATDPTPLRRAAEYLWQKQAADGGWHSEHYAVLRGGNALTPFVLHALLRVPSDTYEPSQGSIERALDFIRRSVDESGAIGRADPDLLEYPNYSTAYAIRCLLLVLAGEPSDRSLIRRMAEYLVEAQYSEAYGFDPSHLAYGGWGFAAPQRPGVADHMDLAHTRAVLQAIAEADAALDDLAVDSRVLQRAESFLQLLQRQPGELRRHPIPPNWLGTQAEWHAGGGKSFDGGFYFSPIVVAANKAGFTDDPPHWRSYATATCDGILALLATGTTETDPCVRDAMDWLASHTDLDFPEGVPRDHPEPWGESIRFYHYQARASVLAQLTPHDASARVHLAKAIAANQQPDGSFANSRGHLMKEDDPLLCTALAVLAFAYSRADLD